MPIRAVLQTVPSSFVGCGCCLRPCQLKSPSQPTRNGIPLVFFGRKEAEFTGCPR